MLVTLDGIVTLVNPLQPENTLAPMSVTLEGIVTLGNSLQPENAESPMLITPSPIVTLVSPLQLRNAAAPMPRTPVIPKSPEREPELPTAHPSTSFTPGIVSVSNNKSPQLENAEFSILATLSGIVRLVRFVQPTNDSTPMAVTPSLRTTFEID